MWFFKQATGQPEPTEKREASQEERVERIEAIPTPEEQREVITEQFYEFVQPLERKLETAAEEKIEHLMDGAGWWQEEKPHTTS